MKLQLEETKQQIESQKVEQQTLQKIIVDTDTDVFQLKKQLEQVGGESAQWHNKVNAKCSDFGCCAATFHEGGERERQLGQTSAAAQQRVLIAVREDSHPAVSPQQRRLPLQ